MVAWGLVLSASLAGVAAAFYAALGIHILRRRVEPSFAWANGAFGSAWLGLALMVATDGGRIVTAVAGRPDPAIYLSLVELKIVATAFAIAAFLAYVLFIYTGRPLAAIALSVTIGLGYTFFFLALTLARLPMQVHVGRFATRLELQPGGSLPGGQAMGLILFFLPLLATTVLYLLLWRGVPGRTHHLRILAVGGSLIVFQVAASVQSNPRVSPDTLALPCALAVMMLTGWLSYWAFRPPKWVRSRFGIRGMDEGERPLAR